jgi:arginine decarboxylase
MTGTSAQAYNSWWQARSDIWSRLDEASAQLASAAASGQALGGLLETIAGLLDSVAPVEQYWAFPGPEACRRARDLFAAGSYTSFASLVARVSRALITESYRAGTGWSVSEDHDEAGPEEAAARPARLARGGPTSRCWSSRR